MPRRRDEGSSGPAYGAGAWSLLFAAFGFYYAAGGTAGLTLQPVAIQEQAGTHELTVTLWITGAMKVMAATLAWGLARPGRRAGLNRAVLIAGLGTGVLLALYGGAELVQAALGETGVHDVPANIGRRAARWKFFFDSVWLVGGALFVLAARTARNA